ncbi:MAG: VanZ family protein [Muribaculaceae bacterium]|nr:VanZ family protein [Muribaculaceae bacterium]
MGGSGCLQKWIKAIFIVYLLIVIRVIVFKYPYEQFYQIAQTWRRDVILEGLGTANFIPFKTIRMYIRYAHKLNSFENLAGNILVFMPFGILLPMLAGRRWQLLKVLSGAFLLALGMELFQLVSAFGAFDVDDILLNCVGAVMGCLIYKAFRKCRAVVLGAREKKKVEEKEYGAYFEEN